MEDPTTTFRDAVHRLADRWHADGLPSRQVLDETALKLDRLRINLGVRGLWERSPTMVTATLDDGLGQGVAIIEAFARAIGMRVKFLGLLQSREAVIGACRHEPPDYLGLTVLQFDTEDDLRYIVDHLPSQVTIIAGGPVFSGDPDFARRTGTHQAARDVAAFLRIMLNRSG